MIPFNQVRIGPFDIKIRPFNSHHEHDNALGMFSTTDHTIFLREEYASEALGAETLLHEIMHGVFDVAGLKQKDGEERIVSQLSLGLAQVFRDNPQVIKWIMETLGGKH